MKKKTILASAIMMAAGAMLGTTTAPEQVTQKQTQQVAEKSAPSRQNQQQQPKQQTRQRVGISDLAFAKDYPMIGSVGGYQHFRKQASWCFTGSKSFNKIRHGRSTRRKHRRAA